MGVEVQLGPQTGGDRGRLPEAVALAGELQVAEAQPGPVRLQELRVDGRAAHRLDQADAGAYATAATVSRLVGAFCAAQGCTGHALPRKLSLACEG